MIINLTFLVEDTGGLATPKEGGSGKEWGLIALSSNYTAKGFLSLSLSQPCFTARTSSQGEMTQGGPLVVDCHS